MLEHFKVPQDQAVMVREEPLRETVSSIFRKMGVNPEDSALATDVLVKADMRGVETHGVSNMLRAYVSGYGSGELNNAPNWRITRGDACDRQHRLGSRPGDHRDAKGYGDCDREGQERGRGNGDDSQLAAPRNGLLPRDDGPRTRPNRHVYDLVPSFGSTDIRRGASAGNEPDRGSRARGQGAAVRVRRRNKHGRGQQAGTCAAAGKHAAARLGRRRGRRADHGGGRSSDAGLPGSSDLVPSSGRGERASRGRTRDTASRASWTSWAGYFRAEASAWSRDVPTSDT